MPHKKEKGVCEKNLILLRSYQYMELKYEELYYDFSNIYRE